MSYPKIVDLLASEGVHTTKGTLKVKMSNFRKMQLEQPPVDGQQNNHLVEQIKLLEARLAVLEGTPEPNLREKVLGSMNGSWLSYRDISMKVFGSESHHNRIRKCITALKPGVVEVNHVHEDRSGKLTRVAVVRKL
jgi:hypothetical protein